MKKLVLTRGAVVGTDGLKGARIAMCECDTTGEALFCVYQIDGHAGFHLECASCRTSYCPTGDGGCHDGEVPQ